MAAIPLRLDTLPRAIEEEDEGIFAVLIDYLQPVSKLTTNEAVRKLDGVSPARTSKDEPDETRRSHSYFVESFWEVMMHVARQLPNEDVVQKKLVDLVLALRTRPDVESEHYTWHDVLDDGSGVIAETWRGEYSRSPENIPD